MWLFTAILSAFFAGITSILAKCGIKKTDSDIATAIRTAVVLLFACIMVGITGSAKTLPAISPKSLLFLLLSGIATGASWICYFKALSLGDINKVVPIDKSSTILSVLLAMFLFGETGHLAVRLAAVAVLAAGIFLMVEKKEAAAQKHDNRWLFYAILSAVFAALTTVLAKIGISGVESNLGTAIRTAVVLVMAWLIVLLKGKHRQIAEISKKELAYISFSGLATGASWLCYYYAIQNGIVSVVVPIDKLSILVTVLFSRLVFGERLSRKASLGLMLMLCGTLIMAIWS